MVFSETSKQAKHINPSHPRALYFNDTVAVGWVPGTEVLELATHDAEQGVSFYTLDQTPSAKPQLTRQIGCLLCHLTWDTLAVPGLTTLSTFPMSDDPNAYAEGASSTADADCRTVGRLVRHRASRARAPHGERPGHPAGRGVAARAGAPAPKLSSVTATIAKADEYPSLQSDVAALMVLNHQTHATNLLTWVGWETRVAQAEHKPLDRVDNAVRDMVDYFLFVDEAPLPSPIAGTSGFSETFGARGPRDPNGRSLRQLDLTTRLMRYPCSYMIYSPAFDALPAVARDRIYARMWRILSGEETDRRYAKLSAADRRAVVEILPPPSRPCPHTSVRSGSNEPQRVRSTQRPQHTQRLALIGDLSAHGNPLCALCVESLPRGLGVSVRRTRDRADVSAFERAFEEPLHHHRFERRPCVVRTDVEARGYRFDGCSKCRR